MQPKFTLRNLGGSGMRISVLALILALTTQFSFSQGRPLPASKQGTTPAQQAELERAKLQRANGTGIIQSIPTAVNDAGIAPRVSTQLQNRTEAICTTYIGQFSGSSPTTSLRAFRDGVPSTCAVPGTCTAGLAGSFLYNLFEWTNPISTTQCITVTHSTTSTSFSFVTAHSAPVTLTNLCANYMGDGGSSPTPGGPVSFSINVPGNATVYFIVTNVTGTPDYNIEIDGPVCSGAPCSGTPAPGNTVSTANPVCPGVNFTLSAQNSTPGSGVTFLWERATSSTGPWSPAPGANTGSVYTTNQASAFWYRVQVTCAGNTGTSNPLEVTMNPPSSCYCLPGGTDCTDNDMITRVQISSLDNPSTCGSGPPPGYTDYTTSVPAPDVFSGAGNTIRLELPPNWPEGCAVWIDYNQNGQFEASEYTNLGTKQAGQTEISGVINIPTTATLGMTRMRVRCRFAAVLNGGDACIGYTFGETEDYMVNIVPCVQITITGSPSNASIACGNNASFTVSTTGSLPAYSWQYRVNASASWQTVTAGGIFSNVNSSTLTLTNVSQAYNGYQFRALVSGGCSAVDFSNFGTLTVTPVVPAVTPPSATICTGTIQQLTLTNTLGNVNLIEESFNSVAPLPTDWVAQNNSQPVGATGWFQGNPAVFAANSGAPNAYIAANFQNTTGLNTISNWLIAPNVPNIKNGDVIRFYTRSVGNTFPDRLQVRLSTAGASTNVGATNTSVGDFTTLLLDINPTYSSAPPPTGYPTVWTQYTITISGLAGPVSGRFAFRYFVENAGPSGSNSDYIGIDDVVYVSAGGPAQGVWTGTLSTMWTDATATTPYTAGSLANTIYVNPTSSTSYGVSFTTPTPCNSAVTNVPVTVVNPVTNVVNPANRSVCVGGSTTFTASASGGPLTYQWQVSADGGVTWTNISGATGTTLTVSGVTQTMNNYRYRLVFTAAPCSGTTNSAAAVLTVNPLPVVTIAAPDVSLAPSQTTTISGSSTPAAAAGGWSWTLNGSALPGTGNTQTADVDGMGVYQATVTDINGCVSSSNELTIGAEATDRLWIYPNPTEGMFQVRLYYDSDVAEKRIVSIYNVLGQIIMSKQFTLVDNTAPYLRMDFDLRHVARGTYAVKVAHQYTGKVVSGLVVVQ